MSGEARAVPLDALHANDYNPRQDIDEADLESLADSIEANGLANALTVRPRGDGGYEVIAGMRRLLALRRRFDDYDVPVTVHNADDAEARMLALAENLDREDLSPLEEAWAFAREITVDYRDVNESYAEYVSEIHESGEVKDSLHIPSKHHGELQELADTIGKGPAYVKYRLEYLVFPEDARQLIDNGDLSKRAARNIVKVARNIDDPRAARRRLADLAEAWARPLRNGEYNDLKQDVDSTIEDYETQKKLRGKRLEQAREHVGASADRLATAIEDVAADTGLFNPGTDALKSDGEFGFDVDGLLSRSEDVRVALKDRHDELRDRREELDDEYATLDQRHTFAQEAVNAFGHDAVPDGECAYCGCETANDQLVERVNEIEEQLEDLDAKSRKASDRMRALEDHRRAIGSHANELRDAIDNLNDVTDAIDEESATHRGEA